MGWQWGASLHSERGTGMIGWAFPNDLASLLGREAGVRLGFFFGVLAAVVVMELIATPPFLASQHSDSVDTLARNSKVRTARDHWQ